ncbi:MAG: hypothetical protein ACI88H_003399 [Cocleimonas sp.]|jgi:hypothetical protein
MRTSLSEKELKLAAEMKLKQEEISKLENAEINRETSRNQRRHHTIR